MGRLSNFEISYNLLNLPTRLFCWGDYAEYYDYLADGTKVRHAYQDGQERIYAGSLVYDQGVFESAPFGGGRIVSTYDDSEAHYFLTDHLGSTRVVAKVTSAGRDDLDRKDYYPFGKAWTQADMPTSGNRYTFSGKEQVDVAIEDGITTPIHDFGARYYDPDGALFFQQNPLMEKYYSIGQYNYCVGNPVKFTDENGKQPGTAFKSPDVAAKNWGQYYNGKSILIGREMSSSIYLQTNNKNVSYTYSEPAIGKSDGVIPSTAPNGETVVATIHSHGKYEKGYLNNEFSEADKDNAKDRSADSYVATPNGSLKKYDHKTGNITVLSTDLPSDPTDPDRKNEQDPVDIPKKIKEEEAKRFVETLQREGIIPSYSTL